MDEPAGFDESFSEETFTSKTQPYQCGMCDYSSQFRSNLIRHLKIHEDANAYTSSATLSYHMCDVCGKLLKTKYGLKQHTDTQHKLSFRFMCDTCNRGFNSLYNYKGHMASHQKVLKEKCSICLATFQYKSSLQDHIMSQHDGGTYQCEVKDCQKTFTSTRALREHKRVVHQNKRYTCPKCDKTFKWRSSMAFHEKTAHAK